MDLSIRTKPKGQLYKAKLPNELIHEILSMVSLRIIHIVAKWLNPNFTVCDILDLIHERHNPITYLSELVDDPKELLIHMQNNLAVLSGSRAAGYFNTNLCSKGSDWDFYVVEYAREDVFDKTKPNLVSFTNYLLSIGMKRVYIEPAYAIDYEDLITGIEQVVTLSTKKGYTVQVISHYDTSNIDRVAQFDLSAVQCMITGYCAISMHHRLTRDNKSIWWKGSRMVQLKTDLAKARDYTRQRNVDFTEEDENEYKALNAYNNRLIKYINRGVEILLPENESIRRFVGDDKCFIVDFQSYDIYKFQTLEYYPNLQWIDSNELNASLRTETGNIYVNRLSSRTSNTEVWKF